MSKLGPPNLKPWLRYPMSEAEWRKLIAEPPHTRPCGHCKDADPSKCMHCDGTGVMTARMYEQFALEASAYRAETEEQKQAVYDLAPEFFTPEVVADVERKRQLYRETGSFLTAEQMERVARRREYFRALMKSGVP